VGAALTALVFALCLGLGGRSSRLVFATLSGYLVLVHSITLVAGLVGRLTVGGVAAPLGLALAVAVVAVRRAGRDDREVAGPRYTATTLFTAAVAIVTGSLWAWPHLFGATLLWVWDDYTYHMVYPARWLQSGSIAAATPVQAFTAQAWYPLSASVVSTWFMLPFHPIRSGALAWVSLTGVLYGGLVAAGTAELFARLGCRRGAWAVPLVLFATSSRTVVMASSFSDADLAQAATLFAAFAFAVPRRDDESRRDVAVDGGYAALLSGLALGVKVSAAVPALIVLAMTVLRARASARGARGRAMVRTALVFAVGWMAVAGYWYARNLVHTGNPVYPAAFLVWPGVTFPETTLLEYARRYGWRRTVADALSVYGSWPLRHAVLAVIGLAGVAGWSLRRLRATSRPRRYFAWGTLAIAAAILALLPAAPYSAGNPLTFRSGFIHWDSMRYVALLPILGWTALGFLVGAGVSGWRALGAIVIVLAALLAPGSAFAAAIVTLLKRTAATMVVLVLVSPVTRRLTTVRRRALAVGGAVLVAGLALAFAHRAKVAATESAFHAEPLFGAAAAVLDGQPPGARVAVFGDQWIFPAFGDRGQLRPVRLDGDGRLATAPVGGAMEPGELRVDPATFRANLRASAIDVVVLVRQPHPGRPYELPSQHAALRAAGDAALLYQDRAVAIWRLGR
jgi:hypothetical protein